MKFLKELNEQQKKAVLEVHSRIFVMAGPGCGKTKTLVSRALYLFLIKKIKPENVLILTFAKKAIKEIRERLFSEISQNNFFNIYNFHSFGFNVLNEHYALLGFPNKFLVYDRYDQEMVIRKIIQQSDKDFDTKKINDIIAFISNTKNGKALDGNDDDDFYLEKKKNIYLEYEKYLKKNNALDFNDLLVYVVKLFNENPEIRDKYRNKFLHILLDESQDMNSIQWKIVEILSGPKQKVFMVGDVNQVIYSFQGANPDSLISFMKDDEWKTIFLDINYRSSNNILQLSNSFLEYNQTTMVKNILVGRKKETDNKAIKIECISLSGMITCIQFLVMKEKLRWSDIAILYRNNYLANNIEVQLIKRRIPYEILGSYKFIERGEVKDVLSLCRVVTYQDNLSLIRMLKWQKGIGVKTLKKLEKLSVENNLSIFDYLAYAEDLNWNKNEKNLRLGARQKKKIYDLFKKIKLWKENVPYEIQKINDYISEIITDFSYQEYLEKNIDFLEKKTNVERLINVANNWERSKKMSGEYIFSKDVFCEFLQWLVITFEEKDLFKERDNLILSSIHQTKGLEFEAVFFAFLDKGILPHHSIRNLIEERRLFYVGITRAKRFLFLVSNTPHPSSFLEEVDQKYLTTLFRKN